MKQYAKQFIASILGWQVRRLRRKHHLVVIGVVGSIGKTSTKFALANVLGVKHRVRFQKGNYNDLVSVPLVFFGLPMPSVSNPIAWLITFVRIEARLHRAYPYDVVIAEIGIDKPGQMKQYAQYLKLDITVVTAITEEHMEYFKTLDTVAREEFAVAEFSNTLVVNRDLCDQKYLDNIRTNIVTFGAGPGVQYFINNIQFSSMRAKFDIKKTNNLLLSAQMQAVSKSELYSATAASVVADLLHMSVKDIKAGIGELRPVSGRMQRLNGIKNSLILDESYNASPAAMKAALDSLYALDAPQKIALLGNMNELGATSQAAHLEIGNYCEPAQLDFVVTLGPDANNYLAAAAKAKGCEVHIYNDPYSAGEFIKSRLVSGAVVLVKGSQNKVYAEEAIKPLLKSPEDVKLLVRQSRMWLRKKKRNFKS